VGVCWPTIAPLRTDIKVMLVRNDSLRPRRRAAPSAGSGLLFPDNRLLSPGTGSLLTDNGSMSPDTAPLLANINSLSPSNDSLLPNNAAFPANTVTPAPSPAAGPVVFARAAAGFSGRLPEIP
jgi:hypothetical protein